ncbi:hypothetical protein [Streptomyces sp.]|uniref:hypothetical protein n=1 Tax=Streptomyces sp. TaxID=1931 RepID=UPI002F416E1A
MAGLESSGAGDGRWGASGPADTGGAGRAEPPAEPPTDAAGAPRGALVAPRDEVLRGFTERGLTPELLERAAGGRGRPRGE